MKAHLISRGEEVLLPMQEEQQIFTEQESYFLNTFPLIRRLAKRRLGSTFRDHAEDIVQRVGFNLWRWKTLKESASINEPALIENHDFSRALLAEGAETKQTGSAALTEEAWQSLANAATRNEVNSFFRSKYRREEAAAGAALEQAAQMLQDRQVRIFGATAPQSPAGNSRAEIASLLSEVWRIVDAFPLKRKYAYLLGKEELLVSFITHGCATRSEIAASLEVPIEELNAIIKSLPVRDERIAELLANKTGAEISLRQIWTWRAKAKTKLAEKLREVIS